MTTYEYSRAIAELEYQRVVEIPRKIARLAKDCNTFTMIPPKTHFRELEYQVMHIKQAKQQELEIIFNFFDERDKPRAIIPKNLFPIPEIEQATTKQVPIKLRQLTNSSARGFEIQLDSFATILQLQTSKEVDLKLKGMLIC